MPGKSNRKNNQEFIYNQLKKLLFKTEEDEGNTKIVYDEYLIKEY